MKHNFAHLVEQFVQDVNIKLTGGKETLAH